jgi:RimJ/RimL family protein N-acetyltransferase
VTSAFLEAPVLRGDHVLLELLAPEHEPELAEAVADGELWRLWVTRIPSPQDMAGEIRRRLAEHAAGTMVPWTVRDAGTGRAVGMTTYMNVRPQDRRLEIGSTWLSVSAQGTGVNPEAKLLMLGRAFDELGCVAVEFRTHWHNRRSRRAIEALGAKQDGVLRNQDLWRDGTVRDVVVYSVIDAEWPTVRLGLRERLRRLEHQGRPAGR